MHSSEDNTLLQEEPNKYLHTLMDALQTIHEIKEERLTRPSLKYGDDYYNKMIERNKQDKQTQAFDDEARYRIYTLKKQGLDRFQFWLDHIVNSNDFNHFQQIANEAPFVITEQDKEEEAARLALETHTPSSLKESSTEVNTEESSSSTPNHTTEEQKEVDAPVSPTNVRPVFFTDPKNNTPSKDKQQKTDSIIPPKAQKETLHPENTSSDENTPDPIESNIDWNLCFKVLSGIATVAGGAMLVVGLLLPLPGLAIAGACLLGIGVIGYFAASRPSSEDDKEECDHFEIAQP